MTVDLLVCNYNTKDHLKNLLDHLHVDYEPNVWKLYIQDNGSTDGSAEWLEENLENYSTDIIYVERAENVGYAAAINKMASLSNSDLLAAINADTQFSTRHVKQVQKSFDDNPEQAICGPKQIDGQHRIKHGGIFWQGRGSKVIHRGWNEVDPRDQLYKDRQRCWTVSGSIYYVRRSIWDILAKSMEENDIYTGGYPGAFLGTNHYYEETFCSVHAGAKGYEVWYDGTVETAFHAWHASAPVGGAPERDYWANSQRMYIDACNKLNIEHEC